MTFHVQSVLPKPFLWRKIFLKSMPFNAFSCLSMSVQQARLHLIELIDTVYRKQNAISKVNNPGYKNFFQGSIKCMV